MRLVFWSWAAGVFVGGALGTWEPQNKPYLGLLIGCCLTVAIATYVWTVRRATPEEGEAE